MKNAQDMLFDMKREIMREFIVNTLNYEWAINKLNEFRFHNPGHLTNEEVEEFETWIADNSK